MLRNLAIRCGLDPVEALAVHVHDPDEAGNLLEGRVHDRLPDRALVELGVAEVPEEPARRRLEPVGRQVLPHQGRVGGGGDAESHGPRGEVDVVGILRPARVRLEPLELPECREPRLVQEAEQVLDGMEDWGRVGLHRDPVWAVSVSK
jgi:hypothetical protein